MTAIAIIGMACRYPQARSPRELWENVLAQRRAFRRIPDVRLRLDDYSAGSSDDQISVRSAALLEDYEFDRVRFQVSRETFLSTDLAHWLALDVAAQALEGAGLLHLTENQRERAGVYIGNSLTGEFSRANLLRLRWPHVRRVLTAVLQEKGACTGAELGRLIEEIEARYKAPFPATTEDSLAGGLSNTIAGRICNYFDFKGGGYTVDGACASSLLAVTTACSALAGGDIDIAIAGGVDLSLDPFELAGFSRLGALAQEKMRVYDERSAGFWPGEGCGMVVLMRHEEALAEHHAPHAVIRGWGVSSDGRGGITRPELSGQSLALKRAYQRAGYGIDSVAYFEGHGTGTTVGDAVELQALSQARHAAHADAPAAIGSIKANIGHTKAAAGVAGLIKAAMAVQARILPPTTGCDSPHAELRKPGAALRVLREGELWPEETPLRAAVSAMGFGGINTHVTLEAPDTFRRTTFTPAERRQLSSVQDCELFLLQSSTTDALAHDLRATLNYALTMAESELAGLAAHLAQASSSAPTPNAVRAACVASTPAELHANVSTLLQWCQDQAADRMDAVRGLFFSASRFTPPKIGFLFPGQGSPVYTRGGLWSRRFAAVREVYQTARLPEQESIATEIAQPCVVTASLAGMRILEQCGIRASVALGHSLGELTALYWGGACEEQALLRIVSRRGQVMAAKAEDSGAMASIRADAHDVKRRLNGDRLVIAAYNSPRQTVISGEAAAIRKFVNKVSAEGISATALPVSHAFHSPLVQEVAASFAGYLAQEQFAALRRRVISTVTGTALEEQADVRELLRNQITSPVQFARAVTAAAQEADLFIEVGPGSVLSGIAAECTDRPVIALNAGSESLRGLLSAVGACFVLGTGIRPAALFEDRAVRPFQSSHTFLANPCESAADVPAPRRSAPLPPAKVAPDLPVSADTPLEILRALVAQRTDLPLTTVTPDRRFLDDLHLNSITISQIILEAAGRLHLPPPAAPAEYTNSTLAAAAQALEGLRLTAPTPAKEKHPQGIDSWIRVLGVELVVRDLPQRRIYPQAGSWQVVAVQDFPQRQEFEQAFRNLPGNGMVCYVPDQRNELAASFLLNSVQAALQQKISQFIFVQRSGSAAALARTLYLEHPELKVTVINVPENHAETAAWAVCEAAAAAGFTEVYYDSAGIRREPRLKVLWPDPQLAGSFLAGSDLLLVTGGGKGIAAECALQLARESGCRLALIGRSDATRDPELRENLSRFTAAGVTFRYFSADLTQAQAIAAALAQVHRELGTVTALLHGAGANMPRRLEEISAADLHSTLAPKLAGLHHVLAAVDVRKLRLLVTFGSIIGRVGLQGEAHYALANDWLDHEVRDWQQAHPECRCLNLEWSVWAGTGMGQRLGVLESLMQQGISPLPIDGAIHTLKAMLAWKEAPQAPQTPVSAIVTARCGNLPTLRFSHPELPLVRFLEHVQVYYPGIELIADAELSSDTDLYIAEHVFQGEQLLPAVVGMEAMAEIAMALEQSARLPQFRNLRLEHPIVIPRNGSVRLRIAALRRRPGLVSVVIRCSTTRYQLDHFSVECSFIGDETAGDNHALPDSGKLLPLDPSTDLYGRILFHEGRFRRIEGYTRLLAGESIAHLRAPAALPWYARHLPAEFRVGDPASRDAAIHSVQACIPHKTVLPVGVDSIIADPAWTRDAAIIHARERLRDGDHFVYDLLIADSRGQVRERWQGLRLRAVTPIQTSSAWPTPLLAPYLERKLGELLPAARIRIAMSAGSEADQADRTQALARELFGPDAKILHRPDGKPELANTSGQQVSISHCGPLTLTVSANVTIGCDLETAGCRDQACWQKLLGDESFALAQLMAEKSLTPLEITMAQVWTLKEALRKCGAAFGHSLRFESRTADGWTLLSSNDFQAATFHASMKGNHSPLAFAVVTGAIP